jgi:hypothetical protein
MKDLKPKFMLTRVYADGSQDEPEIAPLSQAIEAKMNRRGFFGAGLTAAAALMWMESCEKDESEPEPEPVEPKLEYPNNVPTKSRDYCYGIHAHYAEIKALAVRSNG